MAFAPAGSVEAPTYGQRKYGLFSSLSFRPEGDGRWQNGFLWEQICGSVDILIPDCDEELQVGFPKEPNTTTDYPESLPPFTVYGYHRCSPVDRDTDRANGLAALSLQRQEERPVEAGLWAAIADGLEVVTPTPATTDPSEVFGHLEQVNDARYAGGGLILTSRRLAQWALDDGPLRHVTGSTIGSQLDTPAVAGNFPTLDAIGGSTPTGEWVALIGPVVGYRSSIFYPGSRAGDLLNRGTNDMNAVAERTYAIGVTPPCPLEGDAEGPLPTGYVFDITYGGNAA